jgi:hypothetical protein
MNLSHDFGSKTHEVVLRSDGKITDNDDEDEL